MTQFHFILDIIKKIKDYFFSGSSDDEVANTKNHFDVKKN